MCQSKSMLPTVFQANVTQIEHMAVFMVLAKWSTYSFVCVVILPVYTFLAWSDLKYQILSLLFKSLSAVKFTGKLVHVPIRHQKVQKSDEFLLFHPQ